MALLNRPQPSPAIWPSGKIAALLLPLLMSCGGEVGVGYSSSSFSGSGSSGLTIAFTTDDDLFWCGFAPGCLAYPVIPYQAGLQSAPGDGAIVFGIVRLEVVGSGLSSVALLPAVAGAAPIALFNVASDGTYAWLDLDTRALPNGLLDVEISAFNIVQNRPEILEIIVMPIRTWEIRN